MKYEKALGDAVFKVEVDGPSPTGLHTAIATSRSRDASMGTTLYACSRESATDAAHQAVRSMSEFFTDALIASLTVAAKIETLEPVEAEE